MRRAFLLLAALLIVLTAPVVAQQRYMERLPYVEGSPQVQALPVPALFVPPSGVVCIGNSQPSTERHLGTLYATCNTRRTPTGEPGAAVFALRPAGWETVLIAGVNSSDGQLWIDSLDGRLYLSYTATGDGAQRNVPVPGQGER